jgi:hypothetical protein
MSPGFTQRLFSLVICLAIFSTALAIPNQALNPHSDAAADISYIQDNSQSPAQTNHFHLPLRDGETISVSSDVDNYGLKSNKGWAAHDVWDNNLLRFADTPEVGDGRNALLDKFAHGYISQSKTPLYSFEDNVPADARMLLSECFTEWYSAANEAISGNTSPSGKPLQLGIAFNEAGRGDTSQFYYRFSDSFQGARKAYAEWIVSDDRVGLGGGVGSKNSMVFEANPANFVRAPQGVKLTTKASLVSTDSFPMNVGWSYDKTPDPIEVDLQYVKDGQTFESLPGEMLTTNTGLKIPCDDKIKFYQMDFFTIALHETGHILGLLHAPDDPVGNIMREHIEYQASWNKVLQDIDHDSAYGAALLYTIPVPEPGSLALVLAGLLVNTLVGKRRQWPRAGRFDDSLTLQLRWNLTLT